MNPKIPENTSPAFEYAAQKKISVVELDIRLTKDNIPIIFHGPYLEKTSSGKGKAENKNLSELKQLDWGYYTKSKKNETDPAELKPKHTFQKTPLLTLDDYLSTLWQKVLQQYRAKEKFFLFQEKLRKRDG